MKIAHLVCGHLRTFRDNATLVPNFIKANPGDVFLHTFSVRNLTGNKWHGDENGAGEAVTEEDLEAVGEMFDPVAVEVVGQTCGADFLESRHAAMGFRAAREQALRLFNSWCAAVDERYDLVTMTRFDLGFYEPVKLPERIDPTTLYGGYNANQARQGCDGEVFVFGTPDVLRQCFVPSVPPALADECTRVGYHGEWLSTQARKLTGVDYEAFRVPHFLYRSGGFVLPIEQ